MKRYGTQGLLIAFVLTTCGPGRGDEPSIARIPGIRESQVSVSLTEGRYSRAFRATVLAKTDTTLTLLTAAHCVKESDTGKPSVVIAGGEVLEGKVLSVVRNPSYHPEPGHDLPGPDNAVARLQVRAGNRLAEDALERIQPALQIADRPYPAPGGQGVVARIIDGRGQEREIRGGNFTNPLWLEWARGYKPIPGDSGSGVFFVGRTLDGKPKPILIGVVVGHGLDGGGASLVSLRQKWIVEALKAVPATP